MIRRYLSERRSWIVFYISVHLLILFVAALDESIPFTPVLYMVYLSAILFIIFMILRYNKETKFYRRLEQWNHDLDLAHIAPAESPFEQIVETSIISQTESLQRIALHNQTLLEQEKDELLSWIHDVKTPLTAMRLMIDRLNDDAVKASMSYEWLRIHLLLDRQLYQKRLPFMENDLYIEQVDLEKLFVTEIKTLQSWCIQKGLGFDMHLQTAEVLSDAKWLAFIIRQLLTNAVKYSGDHAPDILISSFEHHQHAVLQIKDFGRGIDPKDLPRIFDRGFTSTTNHLDYGATGMGLYLARRAAEALLIHIDVDSVPGAGATFTLTFPKRNDFTRIAGM